MNIFGINSLSLFGNSASKSDNENVSRESFADVLSKMSDAKQPAAVNPASAGIEGTSVDSTNVYHEKLQILCEKIELMMSQLGIDTTGSPLTMHLNPNGELVVSGEHSQKPALQKAIANSPDLQELFKQVANLAEEIAKTYNPDGIQALIDSNDAASVGSISLPERFSLRLDGTFIEPDIG